MRQTILITGASSGFGAMTAKALARAGNVWSASASPTFSTHPRKTQPKGT